MRTTGSEMAPINHRELDERTTNPAAPLRVKFHAPTDVTATDSRILRTLRLMEKSQSMEPASIAAILNLSVSRFRHLFKKETGMSVRQYQKLVQLERARELLQNSVLRVKEITAIIGIRDVSHFTRDYKAHYRQTPSQTRALTGSQ